MAWNSLLHKHITFKECSKGFWGNYCRNEKCCYKWNIDHSFRSLTTLWISLLVQKTNLLSVTTVHHRNRRNGESLSKYRATKSFLFGSWYSSKWIFIFVFKFLEVLKYVWSELTGLARPPEWIGVQRAMGYTWGFSFEGWGGVSLVRRGFCIDSTRVWSQNGWGWTWPLEVISSSLAKLWIVKANWKYCRREPSPGLGNVTRMFLLLLITLDLTTKIWMDIKSSGKVQLEVPKAIDMKKKFSWKCRKCRLLFFLSSGCL